MIQAWASQKNFRPKGDDGDDTLPEDQRRNAERDFHGEKRLNDTHESRTDPEGRNYKKSRGSEAKMAYLGHTVMENRNGLIVKADASLADGYAERDTALAQLP